MSTSSFTQICKVFGLLFALLLVLHVSFTVRSKYTIIEQQIPEIDIHSDMGSHSAFFYGMWSSRKIVDRFQLTWSTGTLMAPPVLYRVIYGTTKPEDWQRNLTTVQPALLQNYRRHKVKHADYPAIVPYESSSVRGTFVTGLLDEDVRRLDIFEGDQYNRDRVRVKVLKSEKIGLHDPVDESRLDDLLKDEQEAETYVWSDPRRFLEEEEWDFDEFRREKMWAWVGESQGIVDVDEGFADVDRDVAERKQEKHDPTGGRGVNGKIGRELEAEREKSAAV